MSESGKEESEKKDEKMMKKYTPSNEQPTQGELMMVYMCVSCCKMRRMRIRMMKNKMKDGEGEEERKKNVSMLINCK